MLNVDYIHLLEAYTKEHRVYTRSQGPDTPCSCQICYVGGLNGREYLEYCKTVSNKPGRPTLTDSTSPRAIKICSSCFSEVGPGVNHTCSKNTKQNNVVGLIRQSSEKTTKNILGESLKSHYSDLGVERGQAITLSTRGPNISAVLGQPKNPIKIGPTFTHDSLFKLQLKRNLSDNDLLEIRTAVRKTCGKLSVESGMKYAMKERNNKLHDHFETKICAFIEKKSKLKSKDLEDCEKIIERSIVAVKDIDSFVNTVITERKLNP